MDEQVGDRASWSSWLGRLWITVFVVFMFCCVCCCFFLSQREQPDQCVEQREGDPRGAAQGREGLRSGTDLRTAPHLQQLRRRPEESHR